MDQMHKTKLHEFPNPKHKSNLVNIKMNKVGHGWMQTQQLGISKTVNSNCPHTYLHMELTLPPLLFKFLQFVFQELYFDSNGTCFI